MNNLLKLIFCGIIISSCANHPEIQNSEMAATVDKEGYIKYIGPPLGSLQGTDEIIIGTNKSNVWKAIADSSSLPEWGPPVKSVEIKFAKGETKEGLGTVRKVFAVFDGEHGSFMEHRTEEVFERRIAYMIDSDEGFGITEKLDFTGFNFDISEVSSEKTKVVMNFTHEPAGLMAWIMNPIIKWKFGVNRRKALIALKKYCEDKANY